MHIKVRIFVYATTYICIRNFFNPYPTIKFLFFLCVYMFVYMTVWCVCVSVCLSVCAYVCTCLIEYFFAFLSKTLHTKGNWYVRNKVYTEHTTYQCVLCIIKSYSEHKLQYYQQKNLPISDSSTTDADSLISSIITLHIYVPLSPSIK